MLPECCCDLPLVLPQVDNLLLDHKVLGVPRQKVFELLDVLSRNVTDLWRRLGPVTKETLDGNLSASPILPKMKNSNIYDHLEQDSKQPHSCLLLAQLS